MRRHLFATFGPELAGCWPLSVDVDSLMATGTFGRWTQKAPGALLGIVFAAWVDAWPSYAST